MLSKIENQYYWLERMIQARVIGEDHQAIFHTDKKTWNHIQSTQGQILTRIIPMGSTVIDVGCGAGFLLDCLAPGTTYLGVDLNPYLIEWARRKYEKITTASFEVLDAQKLNSIASKSFDWSVSRSVVGCCGVHSGYDAAHRIHTETVRVGKRSIFLGYDPADQFTFGEDPDHPLTLGTLR